MKALICCLLTAIPLVSNAGLIATANGFVTSGCNNCGTIDHDLFGLGSNTDLAGQLFSVQFDINDPLLATTSRFGTDWVMWQDNGASMMNVHVTMNGKTYDVPSTSTYIPFYQIFSDGRVALHFQNENVLRPPGYEGPEFGPYMAYDHVSMVENGAFFFNSWELLGDRVNQTLIRDFRTTFTGTIGDITIRPAASVPEPSTIAILGFGLLGLATIRRRRSES